MLCDFVPHRSHWARGSTLSPGMTFVSDPQNLPPRRGIVRCQNFKEKGPSWKVFHQVSRAMDRGFNRFIQDNPHNGQNICERPSVNQTNCSSGKVKMRCFC